MYNFKTISVVIPCRNEQEGLDKVLRCKPSFIDELIVVNNNSTDSTVDIAQKYGATIVHEKKCGYGQPCLAGLSKINGDIIVVLDGDGTYSMAEAEKILLHLENGHYDFVTGNRYPLVNKKAQPVIIKVTNYGISWLIRILFRINLKDSQSGKMVFKKSLLYKIKVYNTNMGFCQEIKIRAFIRGDVRCGEVPICYGVRTGKSKFRKTVDGIKNLYSVFCLWRELVWSKAIYTAPY